MPKYPIWIASTILAATILSAGVGCQSTATPDLWNPGPLEYQRHYSEAVDPYPEQDMAPEALGGRPRDYEIPRAQPRRFQNSPFARSRWNPTNWFSGW